MLFDPQTHNLSELCYQAESPNRWALVTLLKLHNLMSASSKMHPKPSSDNPNSIHSIIDFKDGGLLRAILLLRKRIQLAMLNPNPFLAVLNSRMHSSVETSHVRNSPRAPPTIPTQQLPLRLLSDRNGSGAGLRL
jgi:hypothetical protein